MIDDAARGERQLQLLIRTMTHGVLSERDRLLTYSVGEFYQELSLFLEEADRRKKLLAQSTTAKK